MEKLVVMDYSDSSVTVYTIDNSDNRESSEILESLGHNIDECSFMWCESITINLKDA